MQIDKISVVIPNYNGEHLLKKFLLDLEKVVITHNPENEIIIVDNGSKDKSVNFIKNNFPKIKVICLQKNLGFGPACNIGAKKSSGKFILFLNNDIKITQNFIELFLKYFTHPDIFAVYPSIYVPRRKRKEGRKRRIFRFNMYKGASQKTEDFTNRPGYAIYPPGCCFLVKKEHFLQLGGFDELFSPCYWEDIDLGYRGWKRGLRTLYVPSVTVYHLEGETTKFINSYFLKKISVRNKLIFIWKNYSDPLLLFVHFISLIFKSYEGLIKGQKWFLAGLWEAIRKRKEILRKRNIEKKFWRFSDRKILRVIDEEIK